MNLPKTKVIQIRLFLNPKWFKELRETWKQTQHCDKQPVKRLNWIQIIGSRITSNFLEKLFKRVLKVIQKVLAPNSTMKPIIGVGKRSRVFNSNFVYVITYEQPK